MFFICICIYVYSYDPGAEQLRTANGVRFRISAKLRTKIYKWNTFVFFSLGRTAHRITTPQRKPQLKYVSIASFRFLSNSSCFFTIYYIVFILSEFQSYVQEKKIRGIYCNLCACHTVDTENRTINRVCGENICWCTWICYQLLSTRNEIVCGNTSSSSNAPHWTELFGWRAECLNAATMCGLIFKIRCNGRVLPRVQWNRWRSRLSEKTETSRVRVIYGVFNLLTWLDFIRVLYSYLCASDGCAWY